MTAPSTTILVNGTTEDVSMSDATSVDGEEESPERHPAEGYLLDHLSIPPSTADVGDDQPENLLPAHAPQQGHEGDNTQHTPPSFAQTNGIHHPLHRTDTVTDRVDHQPAGTPVATYTTSRRENLLYPQNLQPTTTSAAPPSTSTLAPAPSSIFLPSTAPSPSPHRSATDSPSNLRSTTPLPSSAPAAMNQDPARRSSRRRLREWVRRRRDHPLPWRIDVRRRTENIRRMLREMERLLP
ncbi:MAG: hypothetical protein LQ350_005147 [Teloschistes chrysophthalmus]|nr:MAG: hypothetical protein LQ350_005147 [Niorma chrysophthalma]